MRTVIAGVLLGIFVSLCIISFQLSRIERELAVFGDARSVLAAAAARPPETRAQRNERLQQEQRETIEDMKAILSTPAAPTSKQAPRRP